MAELPVAILDAVAAASGCGLLVLDGEDRVEYWSQEFFELTGLEPAQVVGRKWNSLMLPSGIVTTSKGVGARLTAATEALPGIVLREVAGGNGRRVGILRLTTVSPEQEDDECLPVMVSETETGIPNRKALMSQLQRQLAYQRRYQVLFSLLLLRLRNLTAVVTVLGSEEWNLAQRALYDQLSAYVRMSDSVGFYDDDCFWVILTNSDSEGTLVVAEKLKHLVGTMQLGGFAGCLEVVICAVAARYEDSPGSLLQRALAGLERAAGVESGIFFDA